MGQYFMPFNLDKMQRIYPIRFGGGLKLTETCYVGNAYQEALSWLLANDWKGDCVVYCGDYADDPSGTSYSALRKTCDQHRIDTTPWGVEERFEDVSSNFSTAEREVFEPVECLKPNISGIERIVRYQKVPAEGTYGIEPEHYRFVANETQGTYFDRNASPVAWIGVCCEGADNMVAEVDVVRYDPLPLFLACGNGMGGGDYYGAGSEEVGTWAFDCVVPTNERPVGMSEIACPFDESGLFLTASDETLAKGLLGKKVPGRMVRDGKACVEAPQISSMVGPATFASWCGRPEVA